MLSSRMFLTFQNEQTANTAERENEIPLEQQSGGCDAPEPPLPATMSLPRPFVIFVDRDDAKTVTWDDLALARSDVTRVRAVKAARRFVMIWNVLIGHQAEQAQMGTELRARWESMAVEPVWCLGTVTVPDGSVQSVRRSVVRTSTCAWSPTSGWTVT